MKREIKCLKKDSRYFPVKLKELDNCPEELFVLGDEKSKVARLMKEHNCDSKKATEIMKAGDKRRKKYHNSHCEIKWGDSRNYDISINACRIGVDEAVRILIDFIDTRRKKCEM